MRKISSVEYGGNPYARIRQEQESVITSEKALYAQESESLSKENEKLSRDWEKLRNKWHKKELSEQEFVEKGRTLEARYKAMDGKTVLLQKRQDAILAALEKQNASFYDEVGEHYQKLRMLTSLAVGTYRATSAIKLLHDSLGDFAATSDRKEKLRIMATVRSIFDNASELNPTSEVPSILDDYDRLPEGEARTSFYKAHRSEIHSAYSAQQIQTLENEISSSNNPTPRKTESEDAAAGSKLPQMPDTL